MKETDAFRLLASADRQLVLHELVDSAGGVSEEALARRVAARRYRTPPDAICETRAETAHARLTHVHLPALRDFGVVEWHDGEVELADDGASEQLLEAARELEQWPPTDLLRGPA